MAEKKIVLTHLSEYPYKSIAMGTTKANLTGLWRYWRVFHQTKRSPCDAHCPAGNHVVGFVQAVEQGNWTEAAAILREENPLAAVTGRICHHPCERNCNRRQFDSPVAIQSIERHLATIQVSVPHFPKQERIRSAAVVGSGPAALAFAHYLEALGHKITLFEEQRVLGGVLRQSVSSNRLPAETLDSEIDRLLSGTIEVQRGRSLAKDFSLAELDESYDAVYLTAGVRNASLRIDGAEAGAVFATSSSVRGAQGEGAKQDTRPPSAVAGGYSGAIGMGKRAALLLDAGWRGLDPREVLDRIQIAAGPTASAGEYRRLLLGDPKRIAEGIVTFDQLCTEFFDLAPCDTTSESATDAQAVTRETGDTLTAAQAMQEAARCFSCGRCNACDNCWLYCPDLCVSREHGEYKIDYDYCKGCRVCVATCPRGAISVIEEGKWKG